MREHFRRMYHFLAELYENWKHGKSHDLKNVYIDWKIAG